MIIDSSAIISFISREPEYERIRKRIAEASDIKIGAPTRLECGIVLSSRYGARGKTLLARFLQRNGIECLSFTEVHSEVALDAFSRFGKGRHPAKLNMGDCCSYAVAHLAGEPLLCIGDGFPRTDLTLVNLDDM